MQNLKAVTKLTKTGEFNLTGFGQVNVIKDGKKFVAKATRNGLTKYVKGINLLPVEYTTLPELTNALLNKITNL